MRRSLIGSLAATIVVSAAIPMAVQAAETVTVSNFVRAETDRYFDSVIAMSGDLGTFQHYRQPTPVEHQPC